MTTTTYSYFFSSDPANGATPMDSTGSRFIVQLPQPIRFPQCKNIDLVLNSASIWYTQSNISKTLYDNATFSFAYTVNNNTQTVTIDLPDGLYSLTDVYDQLSLLADLQLVNGVFEKLFTFQSSFSVQKIAIQFLANKLQINWGLSTVRKLLGFSANQDSYPNESIGGSIDNIIGKSIQGDNVGAISSLTSFYIHSSIVNNGLSINGNYKIILGEVPITCLPGELLVYKALAPAISFNANELIGTSWSSLQMWITSQSDTILNMNQEYWQFSITAICTF